MSDFPANSIALQEEKLPEEAATNGHAQNFVGCVHRTKIADLSRQVTTMWSKNLINVSLQIMVENLLEDDDLYTCKIDLNTWQFWGKKGLKSFKVDGKRVDVFWDLRSAKFLTSPEPCSDYYVALVSDQEMVMLLGDQEKEAFKRTKSRPCSIKPILVHKEENVFGKRCFSARTMLGKGEEEHHIFIETSLSNGYEPEMWIGVDGLASFRVTNLHWRFRGYEVIFVDDVPIQVLWNVHDWLYIGANLGPGMFIFQQGANEFDQDSFLYNEIITRENCKEFCHFIYAWMTDPDKM